MARWESKADRQALRVEENASLPQSSGVPLQGTQIVGCETAPASQSFIPLERHDAHAQVQEYHQFTELMPRAACLNKLLQRLNFVLAIVQSFS